ncbi:Rho GTPase activation protein [Chlamydoabsidia padenii]|nr:Rho GTPase activation protein [Chlamydoabsidia padenii]
MKNRDHDKVEKKRQKNPLAFLFRHKSYFFNGSNYKSEGSCMIKGIFGAPLECAAQCGTLTPYGLSVPDPVNRCFTEILARGLRVEGLFRLSGATMEVEQLQQQFDQPPTYGKYLDLTKNDIHAITSLVKKYLRYLPDPVIPLAYQHHFLQLQVNWKHGDRELVFEWAKMIKNEFPTTHYHVMHYIILVVSWIQHYQHVNLMNPEALAVVLAPICSGLEKNMMPSTSVDEIVAINLKWTTVWTLLIQHHDILLDHWRPNDSTYHHHTTIDIQRHSVPTWTQSSMTVPDDDLLLDEEEEEEEDEPRMERVVTTHDDRYGVIVMRKQQHARRRRQHVQGVANDDEHIYLYDTPLPPLPIPKLHHTSSNNNTTTDKKRRFLLRRPKSIASLQPQIKTSALF